MKRLLDIVWALMALVLLSPMLIAVVLLVVVFIGRPVFFTQQRPGLNGKPFTMIKFRSMTDKCDITGALLNDEERLTKFGSFLRASSLDELPEFINVLRGDMSVVGPRPLLTSYLPLYSERQMKRHEVRPGITGWAQVNGRNALDWKDKFELDVWYVENKSFLLDIKIICLTILTVLKREGISDDVSSTMTHFTGNKNEY